MKNVLEKESLSDQEVGRFAEFLLPCIAELFHDPIIQAEFRRWKRKRPNTGKQ